MEQFAATLRLRVRPVPHLAPESVGRVGINQALGDDSLKVETLDRSEQVTDPSRRTFEPAGVFAKRDDFTSDSRQTASLDTLCIFPCHTPCTSELGLLHSPIVGTS
jgi:hypothetical protein